MGNFEKILLQPLGVKRHWKDIPSVFTIFSYWDFPNFWQRGLNPEVPCEGDFPFTDLMWSHCILPTQRVQLPMLEVRCEVEFSCIRSNCFPGSWWPKTCLCLQEGSRSNWMLDKFNKLTVQFVKSREYDLHREINYHSNSNAIQPECICPSELRSIQLHPDRCVLLTACQSDESASDLKTNTGQSYGAFTNAILNILDNHKWPIDNFRLVYEARHRLAKEYNQHPSLYSTIKNTEAVFICY